jgi:alanine racemase
MTIENLRLVRGHPMLLDTAMDAVREWRCQPLVLNDEPAEVKTHATVRFPLAAWDGPWHSALLLRHQGALRHTGRWLPGNSWWYRRNLGRRSWPAIISAVATVEILNRAATRPTWADVSLANLRHNFRVVQRHIGAGVTTCAVVKADGYGHGAVECSKTLEAEGAQWFGVTSLDEAIPLREAGIRGRILLMTGFWRGEEEEIVHLGLTPTVWEAWQVELIEKAAVRLGVARHPVHLKVDTGMGRLGVGMAGLPAVGAALKSAERVILEGLSTHLASSEVLDEPSVENQLRQFENARTTIRDLGLAPSWIHVANTSAVISRQETWNNMVRPGLALYGYYLPFQRAGQEVSGSKLRLPVKPVLTWKTRILALRDVPANQALGYGGIYVTKAPARIAVLPVGYADGYNRKLSDGGRVIVREHYAPLVGRIAMDLTLVDVTGLPGVELGDEVILLGAVDGLSTDAVEHANLADTIPYEVLCNISKRVPRRHGN